MMDDAKDKQAYDRHTIEIELIIKEYREKAQDKEATELLAIRREENAALLDLLQRQKRSLDFMAGEPIEPQTHFGEAVLLPQFGGG